MPDHLRYGPHRPNRLDLWTPTATRAPVVVLLHGGFWRAQYTKRLMAPMAAALVGRGWAVANVEYRRVGLGGGGGGVEATLVDVGRAVDHLATLPHLDLGRLVVVGHSAGGHLALWAAGRHRLVGSAPGAGPQVHPTAAIALAGVADLVEGARLGLGGGAVQALVGGTPAAHPERYARASPVALLPLGVPQVLIHGTDDRIVPLGLSERYVDLARAAGDDARLVALDGVDHMAVIDPSGPSWDALGTALDQLR